MVLDVWANLPKIYSYFLVYNIFYDNQIQLSKSMIWSLTDDYINGAGKMDCDSWIFCMYLKQHHSNWLITISQLL